MQTKLKGNYAHQKSININSDFALPDSWGNLFMCKKSSVLILTTEITIWCFFCVCVLKFILLFCFFKMPLEGQSSQLSLSTCRDLCMANQDPWSVATFHIGACGGWVSAQELTSLLLLSFQNGLLPFLSLLSTITSGVDDCRGASLCLEARFDSVRNC